MTECRISSLLIPRNISEFWNIFKMGFKKRVATACLVVISATFFDAFLHPLMKLFWILVFFVSTELFALNYVRILLPQFSLLINHKKVKWIPIPEEIIDLGIRMNVHIEKLGIKEGLYNAYVKGKSIVLGEELNNQLDPESRLAVIAHEMGHIKGRHGIYRSLLIIPIFLSTWSWLDLPPQIHYIAFFAYIMVIMTPINWRFEFRADRAAAKFAGRENIKSALLTLGKKVNVNESSETHPSIAKRIKLIENIEY